MFIVMYRDRPVQRWQKVTPAFRREGDALAYAALLRELSAHTKVSAHTKGGVNVSEFEASVWETGDAIR